MKTLKIAALVVALASSLPMSANAQAKEDTEDFMKDIVGGIMNIHNWNLFGGGGFTTTDRLLLQGVSGGQQALGTNTGWNVTVGGGADYFLRQGARVYYSYSNNTLQFRTDNGDGSSNLDVDPGAEVHANTIGVELMRYVIPSNAVIAPYGTVGLVGTWWSLSQSPMIVSSGGSTQFRWGGNVAFGVQFRPWEKWSVRLEGASTNTGNPFSGKRSFRTTNGGVGIDEPTSINHVDWRIEGVYYFRDRSAMLKK